jgi:hypothetical protein
VFRLAETEFKFFTEKLTELFSEVDLQIPPLPPKDVIYRIYRDVRPTFYKNAGIVLTQHRFDSAMTRHRTKQTSPQHSQEAGEKVFLPVVCPSMHQYALCSISTFSRSDHMYAPFAFHSMSVSLILFT